MKAGASQRTMLEDLRASNRAVVSLGCAPPPPPHAPHARASVRPAAPQPTRVREVSFLGLRDNAPARPGAEAPRADQHTPVLAPPEQDVSPTGMCFRRELF